MSTVQETEIRKDPAVRELNEFTDELKLWSLKGKEPVLASRELRYVLECQEARIRAVGLTMDQEISHVREEISGRQEKKGREIDAEVLYREAKRHIDFRAGEKTIRTIDEPITFYATRLNKRGYRDFPCTCPNCGYTAMASQMRECCVQCGTVFEIEDAWPVFSSYYSVPGIVERAELVPRIKRYCLTVFLCSAVVSAVIVWMGYTDLDLVFRVLAALAEGALIGGMLTFVFYMLYSLSLVVRLFREAGRSLPLMKGIRTGKKLETRIKQYEPSFSYPYFEGRLISLLRAIAFTKNREELSIYEGDQDLSFLDSVVDMQYRGALQLLDFREQDGVLRVRLKAFMDDLHYKGKIRRKDENFIVVVEKDTGADSDPGFRVDRVQCRSCGASFDALHQKHCPYCGTAYRLIHDDWMITSIEEA